ncbi:Slx9p NDAI_0G01410 [Naumovozyma dairenensis CBS 421]|uniref:Ribosome biogenesis protein SLX9 n=1 Tax=Naumovozyma dairenensis (strain ATCC 10597 / BCRC 20456 / CBS 421 / NBRC 0211 / NRRL Y-12639) TaxID=1071378 RepID=G0WDQ6_NAUDC|nr:hypothetical protein NDAI_0G01410 [Naumovozyma dairenensis CBS 421]CCD25917.2 hypothetical protein NDAI_0G01410 [Naumovozyma dairenensis CBS 421]
MVAKKRNTLRNKASQKLLLTTASSSSSSPIISSNDQDVRGSISELPPDPKAYLHQARESKKDKQLNKQLSFLSKMKSKSTGKESNFDGISKSSIRRRKRKLRDDLKPKMEDLLTSLAQEQDLKEHVRNNQRQRDDRRGHDVLCQPKLLNLLSMRNYTNMNEPGSVIIKKNQPNIRNQKGAKALSQLESKRFTQVLTNQTFQQNPFASLREIIKMQKR